MYLDFDRAEVAFLVNEEINLECKWETILERDKTAKYKEKNKLKFMKCSCNSEITVEFMTDYHFLFITNRGIVLEIRKLKLRADLFFKLQSQTLHNILLN